MRASRRVRRKKQKYQNGEYATVSTFVDKKVFQYTISLLKSGYVKNNLDQVFDYLKALLGEELIEQKLKIKFEGETRSIRRKYMELYDEEYPPDYSGLKKIYSNSKIVDLLKSEILPILEFNYDKCNKNTLTDKNMAELAKLFRLTPTDLEIISFRYTASQSSIFSDAFEGNIVNFQNKPQFLSHGWKILNVSKSEVVKSLRGGNLVKCQIMDLDDCICMSDWLEDYLSGLDNDPNKIFFSKVKEESLPLKNHQVKSIELDVLNQFINSSGGNSILFYGEPGTGKTELARSLANNSQKDLYVINNKDEDNEGCKALKTSIIAACNILDHKSSIILVDEADELLNTQFSFFFSGEKNNKSWINHFLDQSKHQIIWITNRSTQIEPSTMRRFAFSMPFKRFNLKKKLQVFNYCLNKKGLQEFFSEEEIQGFCRRYAINAGGISNALNNLNIRKNANKAKVIERLDTLLKNHEVAITGKEHKGNKMKDLASYSLEALNTSENLSNVLTTVDRFLGRQSCLNGEKSGNLNILLYGMPGSGKTEFVKYLGKALRKEIVLKRASDLTSCWVGETEKNIAQAFDEAEDNQSILFLDEADSFLNPRENARNSWERTEVNELLTQMENFNGVLVCATNFLKGLDQAALRRFKFKLEFFSLTAEGNLTMYQTVLQPLIKGNDLSIKEKQDIQSLQNMTPGDFHVVAEKSRYIDDQITHKQLISSLTTEAQFKPKSTSIGFQS